MFPGRGREGPFCGFGSSKAALDVKLPKDMAGWTVHDLRRTARSLMARAGVLSEHAERLMGHAIGGVAGIYDRHSYAEEKRDALARLAARIDAIVHPRPADIVSLTEARRKTLPPTPGERNEGHR